MDSPFIREALLQEPMDSVVGCRTCERRCTIAPGDSGWCKSRMNRDGRLFTLIYGAISSLAVHPIERKPFHHFRPGSKVLTAGAWACNFACPWCQNWEVSAVHSPEQRDYASPERFVELTHIHHCAGTCVSFNEPTLSLEWSLDVFSLARKEGFYNAFVTNGYMTPEALKRLADAGLDAINVDIKGNAAVLQKIYKNIDSEKIWNICRLSQGLGIHLELTTLVIPTVNDSETVLRDIACRIASELGADVPWHLHRFEPTHQFVEQATPLETLERAWEIGKEAGLHFVYIGNLPDAHRTGDTYCPACNDRLIRRFREEVIMNRLRDGKCPECDTSIPGVW